MLGPCCVQQILATGIDEVRTVDWLTITSGMVMNEEYKSHKACPVDGRTILFVEDCDGYTESGQTRLKTFAAKGGFLKINLFAVVRTISQNYSGQGKITHLFLKRKKEMDIGCPLGTDTTLSDDRNIRCKWTRF